MVESDEVRRASHFPEEHWKPRLHVKLRVRVVLLGLGGGDGSDTPFVLHPKMLQRVLREVLPTYKVPLIEHRKQGRNPLDIECDISYMVKHAGIDSNERYLDVMARAAVRSNVDYPSLLVSIEGISQAVEAIAEKESGVLPRDQEQIFGDTDVTLLVANPNRVELRRRVETLGLLLPNDDIPGVGVEYSFAEPLGSHSREGSRGGRTKASTCACSWVGQGRVLVLDLGSVACNFGAVRQDTPHSIVSKSTFPSGTSSWGEEHWLLSRAQSKSISSSQEERWEKGGTATASVTKGGDINDLSEILRNVQNLGSSANSDGAAVFVAKLSSVLVSAVRTVLVPAVPAVPSSPGKVNGHPIVMVPVLLFRRKGGDGGMGEAKEDENIDSNILAGVVNMTHVSASIKAVGLPGEDVLTIGGVHFLDEHPQVAVALAKSVSTRASYIRSEATRGSEQAPHYKVREEGYVDSTNLFMEIKSAGDTLTSALLSDAGVDALVTLDLALEAGKATKDILGTTDGTIDKDKNQVLVHTLPVFVLSATEHSPPTDRREVVEGVQSMGRPAHLFDNDQVFAAQEGGGVVLVLQAETSTLVPFFEESGNGAMDMIEINLEDATSGVVAGLLTALHGLAPPHEWWSPGSEKMSLDFTWSHGYHPFAPFGFVKGLPGALFVDIAHRNAVASSLAVAASSLSKAIDTLDNFGRSAIPGELLLGEQRASLSTGGGSARAGWGSALSTAAEDSGIPVSHVYHVLSVQHLVSATVERLEGEAEVLPGKRVSEAVNVVKGLERRAQDVLRQTISTHMRGHSWGGGLSSSVSQALTWGSPSGNNQVTPTDSYYRRNRGEGGFSRDESCGRLSRSGSKIIARVHSEPSQVGTNRRISPTESTSGIRSEGGLPLRSRGSTPSPVYNSSPIEHGEYNPQTKRTNSPNGSGNFQGDEECIARSTPRSSTGGGVGKLPPVYAPFCGGRESVRSSSVSSNVFATGGNQNIGNILTDRPISRVLAPPGGHTTIKLG